MKKWIQIGKSKPIGFYIYLILTIATMIAIFLFSAQDKDASTQTSDAVLAWGNGVNASLGIKPIFDFSSFIVRKTAHFVLYFVLCFVVNGTMKGWTKGNSKLWWGWIFAAGYAITDEVHQLFVDGRAGMVRDVLLDSTGAFFGMLLFAGLIKLGVVMKDRKLFKGKKFVWIVVLLAVCLLFFMQMRNHEQAKSQQQIKDVMVGQSVLVAGINLWEQEPFARMNNIAITAYNECVTLKEELAARIENPYDFEELRREQNEDIYAWIVVPNTKIDYPVLQCDEDNFYLRRNLAKKNETGGSLYTNKSLNSKDFTDFNTIIYGHNMTAQTMFGTLHYYDKAKFFEENPYFYIYTENYRYTYEIFSSSKHNDYYLPYEYSDFSSSRNKEAFLEDILEPPVKADVNHVRENVEVSAEDTFVTLSTCMPDTNYRFLVVGKLIATDVVY